MNKESYESLLERDGIFVYTNTGNSMMPLIRPRGDLIIIKRCNAPLKKYDVPLYKRKSGQYVLHRIIKIKKEGYVIRGDNCTYLERKISDSQIIGVLESVVRGNKEIKMDSILQRLYASFWNNLYFLRAPVMKLVFKLKSVR